MAAPLATVTALTAIEGSFNPVVMGALEALFNVPLLWDAASKQRRGMYVKRFESLGVDWTGTVKEMQKEDWDARIKDITNPDITYPEHYKKGFHAYDKGNLCLEAALDCTLATRAVHVSMLDPEGKAVDVDGDAKLRRNFTTRTHELMSQLGARTCCVKSILDVGCATGLSSVELMTAFPGAKITAIDLSPYFLAVGKYEQERREAASGKPEPITFKHLAGEKTGLPSGSLDMVNMSLIIHEMPSATCKAILKEAYRVLKPGGVVALTEFDPASDSFRKMLTNAMAFTAIKKTEPWMRQYLEFDLDSAIKEAGFGAPRSAMNTPKHKTVVAVKPK